MRACDMLTALSIKTFSDCLTGIFYSEDNRLIPFTNIDVNKNGELVLYNQAKQPPLPLCRFHEMLHTHKNKMIVYWTNNTFNPIFGYKDIDGKIVI